MENVNLVDRRTDGIIWKNFVRIRVILQEGKERAGSVCCSDVKAVD
jgi:hypothetical protein